jgi:hypothetical protein
MRALHPATRIVWALLIVASLCGGLTAGWASFRRADSSVVIERTLGPLHETWCSNFVRERLECRPRWLPSKTDWQLVPLFSSLRYAMLGVLLVALLATGLWALGRYSLRPLLSWIGATGLLATAIVIAAVPGDTRYVAFAPSSGALLTLLGFLLLFATAFDRATVDRTLLVTLPGCALLTLALLWAPWLSVKGGYHAKTRYTFGAIADGYAWQGRRATRRHHLGKQIRRPSRRKLGKHLPWYTGMAAAAVGITLVAAVLFALRRRALGWFAPGATRYRRRVLVLLIMLVGLSVAFVALLAFGPLRDRGALSAACGLAPLSVGLAAMAWFGLRGLDAPPR